MTDLREKRAIFWNEALSSHERGLLRMSGFNTPEEMLDVPIYMMMKLDGFGYECTQDLTAALLYYVEPPKEPFVDFAERSEIYLLDLGYPSYEVLMSREERMLLNIEEAFFQLGYDEERVARLTFRELIAIPGVDYEIAAMIVLAVIEKYTCIYGELRAVFRTKGEMRREVGRFFSRPQKVRTNVVHNSKKGRTVSAWAI